MSTRKWIHGLTPELPDVEMIEELPPDAVEMIDGELVRKAVPREWKDGIRLVLNGGVDSLESATVPLEWFFSDELIAERPQYIVICDHEMSLDALKEKERYTFGRRYLVKVTEFVTYIQLFTSGAHHLVFMVFCGDKGSALKRARRYVDNKESCGRSYDWCIEHNDVVNGYEENLRGCYIANIEFEVPQGLLAEKPTSGFSKWVWDWTNRWFSNNPSDECAYRKRLIFAFTFQPLVFLPTRFLVGILGTAYALIAWPMLIFLGWKPKSPFSVIKHCWVSPTEGDLSMLAEPVWRRWQDAQLGPDKNYTQAKYWPAWGVPWVLALEVGVPWSLYRLYRLFPHAMMSIFSIVLTLAVVAAFLIGLFWLGERARVHFRLGEFRDELLVLDNKLHDWLTDRRSRREQARSNAGEAADELYRRRLATISTDKVHVHKKVDVAAVIKKADTAVKFKLGFWATKAKVCRPFSK